MSGHSVLPLWQCKLLFSRLRWNTQRYWVRIEFESGLKKWFVTGRENLVGFEAYPAPTLNELFSEGIWK